MYEIYFAFGLPVRANIRSGRAAVRRCPSLPVAARRCPDRRGRGTGGTEFQAWRTCLPDFPKNGGFTRCGSGWLDRRSERMQKALVDFAAQGGGMLIKFGLSLTFPYL